uniref:NADH-ubiquinone oxidoreductase chain 6 n=1 Tax=Olisthops cyanomelas TaxID=1605466 RepID=A2VCJ3_OLICY|nr:NADH dehydrogenase subunit 6 [Olisthops cyanomelas]BAF46855.1 ND6 [Olisthops cyanomelas]
MSYVVLMLLFGLVLGLVAVASNPSPYFAALGLVLVAGMGCGLLASLGGPFLSLILFLIYLGGMLVVFAYSAALAAEPYPDSWLSGPVVLGILTYLAGAILASIGLNVGRHGLPCVTVDEGGEFASLRGDVGGMALMYSEGGGLLLLGALVLLITLFVVLEVTRGPGVGTLRAV